ncbi:MAG: molybdopterin-dependent oxidoreductase [Bacteroidales bacterium]|nr:molybdopterin-dependent oxidoreductase [Bacteroidales bacterium]
MARQNRRDFIRNSVVAGGIALSAPVWIEKVFGIEAGMAVASHIPRDGWVNLGCPAHNCGGRCLLKVLVRDGVITRIETDSREKDTAADPQLRACLRGRSYRKRQYHPDRLQYPLLRTGRRGEGQFKRISWDEAYDLMASKMLEIKEQYGNEAFHVPYGTGSYSHLNGRWPAARLINLFGGSLDYYNSYSWAAISKATPTVYGTGVCGNQRQDWLNSKYILMWGWNPAEMRDGTNSEYFLKLARQNGARVVCIDPRMTLSAVALADEWIPIRPGTDTAMMSAMAYIMIREGLVDREFIQTHCIGFDKTQMPKGLENEESYTDYILGNRDGIPKTPVWAAKITGVPAATITRIAREFGTIKPAMLYQGYGMQRRAYGEQPVRGGCVLASITGNIGIPGGWASGIALQPGGGPFWSIFPTGINPVKAKIPVFLWTEAILRGPELTEKEGLIGVDKLSTGLKFIWAVASNILINQHSNTNRTAEILRNEDLVKFIVVQDQFLTSSAMFADLVLPACTHFETWGLEDGWKYGEEVFVMPQIVEPYGESQSDFAICAGLAKKLGLAEAFTEQLDERGWTKRLWDEFRQLRFPELPDFEEFLKSNQGVYTVPVEHPEISFADFRRDPEKHPLKTPSGKIEIFSEQLFRMDQPVEIPPIPKYIQEWESPFGPEADSYPLQAIGPHYMSRVHSTHDNIDWLQSAFPQRLFINSVDAEARGIEDGDEVTAFNHRGQIHLPCRVTPRIMPGVVSIPQGSWSHFGKDGLDEQKNVNTLVSERWTPLAFGNAQHTIMVEVKKR